MIPQSWMSITLRDFVSLQRGYDLTESERVEGNIPVIGSGGINGWHDVANVKGPGVALGRSGASFGVAHYSKQDFWAHNTCLFVTDFHGNDELFVFYFLSFMNFKSYNSGGAQPSLNRNFIYPIQINVPPLPEQHKIAEILSTWDEAIVQTERLIAALRERKKGLMQRLLTGQVRFAGFEKSKAKQETKYGEIPVDWDYVTIETVAHQVSVKNVKGDDLTVLSCTKYDGLVSSLAYFGRQIFSEDTSTYKIVKRGQFAYATNHIEEGSIGYQNLYERALISPMYTVFETNSKVDDGFLYKLLKTELYRHIFEVNTSASVDRRGSLRWNVFAQIRIPLPSLKEQKAIAEMLDTCEQEISLTRKQLDTLQQQKKGLMQRLLTGEIRVQV